MHVVAGNVGAGVGRHQQFSAPCELEGHYLYSDRHDPPDCFSLVAHNAESLYRGELPFEVFHEFHIFPAGHRPKPAALTRFLPEHALQEPHSTADAGHGRPLIHETWFFDEPGFLTFALSRRASPSTVR